MDKGQLRPSLFVTFEGGEGAGKTTLITSLKLALERKGYQVLVTREPGGTPLGEDVRLWLLKKEEGDPLSSRAELLLFLAARAQHVHSVILPAMQQGNVIVLCDRFNDSTIVYQGIARGLGLQLVRDLCVLASQSLVPDRTFFIDIDPHVGLKRSRGVAKDSAKTGEVDRIESEALDFHFQVQEGFKYLAQQDPKRIVSLDGSKPSEEVFNQALESLLPLIDGAR